MFEKRRKEIGGSPTPGPVNPIAGGGEARGGLPVGVESRAAYLADLQGIPLQDVEARAQRFAEGGRMEITTDALCRSLTLTSGNIAQPTRVSGINPGQNIVSGIVDMVRVVDANGMGEDSVAYEVSGGQTAATKKDDGTAPATTDPVLRIAKITPVLISTLSYVSRNIQRTTPLNYQGRVSEGALTALRKKTGGLIVTGPTGTNVNDLSVGLYRPPALSPGTPRPPFPSRRVFSRPWPLRRAPTWRSARLTRKPSARLPSSMAARTMSRAAACFSSTRTT